VTDSSTDNTQIHSRSIENQNKNGKRESTDIQLTEVSVTKFRSVGEMNFDVGVLNISHCEKNIKPDCEQSDTETWPADTSYLGCGDYINTGLEQNVELQSVQHHRPSLLHPKKRYTRSVNRLATDTTSD